MNNNSSSLFLVVIIFFYFHLSIFFIVCFYIDFVYNYVKNHIYYSILVLNSNLGFQIFFLHSSHLLLLSI